MEKLPSCLTLYLEKLFAGEEVTIEEVFVMEEQKGIVPLPHHFLEETPQSFSAF